MIMTPIVFETSRLFARQITSADVDALLAVYGDAEAMQWVGHGQALDRAQCEQWVTVTHRNYTTRGYGMVALVERQSGAVIGFCGLVHPDGQPEAEIKYALRREFWGQGLATEAAAALLTYGATVLGLDCIIATVAPANTASQRVLIKAGMRLDQTRRNEDGTFTQVFRWHAKIGPNQVLDR
jgi:RimJ/RimL family protein N-acetyltransferase